jgi:hypothetical protein
MLEFHEFDYAKLISTWRFLHKKNIQLRSKLSRARSEDVRVRLEKERRSMLDHYWSLKNMIDDLRRQRRRRKQTLATIWYRALSGEKRGLQAPVVYGKVCE